MPEREKVVEWLTEISLIPSDFARGDFDAYETEHLANDAVDLLKEKDTVEHACNVLRVNGWKEDLPSVQPERKKGHWTHLGGDEWCCSECGNVVNTEGSWEHPHEKDWLYCWYCGADMR